MVQEVMEKAFENFLLNMCYNLNRILIKKITSRAFQILTGKTLFARKCCLHFVILPPFDSKNE